MPPTAAVAPATKREQIVTGRTPVTAGTALQRGLITACIMLATRGMGTMLAMVLVGRLTGRTDRCLLILLGLGKTAPSLRQMSGFNAEVPTADILWSGVIQGLGLGFIFVPLSATAFSTLARHHRSEGTATFGLMRNIGSSMGISIVVTLLVRNTQAIHASIAGLSASTMRSPGRPRPSPMPTTSC